MGVAARGIVRDSSACSRTGRARCTCSRFAAKLRDGGATAVAILGDANSTDYRDDAYGERTFVDTSARAAGMSVVTGGLSCSAYWKTDGVYAPSLLDHAVATQGLVNSGSARVHGYCEALRCETQRSTPPELESVSDHSCPSPCASIPRNRSARAPMKPDEGRRRAMHTIRVHPHLTRPIPPLPQRPQLPRHAPLPLPPPPPPRRTSTVAVVLAVGATALFIGMYVIACVGAVIAAIALQSDTTATRPDAAHAGVIAVEHAGDDCASLALDDARACEDMQCFAAVGADLRACLAQPEQEARVCSELPDPSLTSASAQWMTARCTFEEERNQNDCVRVLSIVQDHCANVGAKPQS